MSRMSGATTDADEALIDEETLMQIMDHLDIDGDGVVTKDEYMIPWMKLFPKLTREDYDAVWKEMDDNDSGTLSLPELADYYGEGQPRDRNLIVGLPTCDPSAPLTDQPTNIPPHTTGFSMSPSAKRKGDQTAEMTDEQIIEALELSATLVELNAENEQRKKDKEKEELDKVV